MMALLKRGSLSLTDGVAQWCQETMKKKLPRRTKRLILVAAFAARLENVDTLSDEALMKLNEALKLSKHPSALKLPVYLRNVIWRGKDITDLQSLAGERIDIVERTKIVIPSWLHYGRASDMVSDAVAVKMLVEGKWSDEAIQATRSFRRTNPGISA